MTNIKVTESEHPAQQHQQELNNCIHYLRDAVHDYVESEVLTPGEFVSCIRSALSDTIRHHDTRLALLKDTELLLNKNTNKQEFIQE